MTYEEYLKQAKNAVKSGMDESVAGVNTRYDTQKTEINTAFDEQVKKTEEQYSQAAREIDIQKLIDEKQVQENVSNMGLDNSGFNDTQKTAVQLSYGNRKFSLGKSKAETLGELSLALAQAISENEIKRQTEIEGVKQSYDKLAIDNATSAYNTAQKEYTEQYKASLSASEDLAKRQSSAYNDLVEKLLKKDTDALGNKLSVYSDKEKARLIYDYVNYYTRPEDIEQLAAYAGIDVQYIEKILGVVDPETEEEQKQAARQPARQAARANSNLVAVRNADGTITYIDRDEYLKQQNTPSKKVEKRLKGLWDRIF